MACMVLPTWSASLPDMQKMENYKIDEEQHATYIELKNFMLECLVGHTLTEEIIEQIRILIAQLFTETDSLEYFHRHDENKAMFPLIKLLAKASGLTKHPWDDLLTEPCGDGYARRLIDMCLMILAFCSDKTITGTCRTLVEHFVKTFAFLEPYQGFAEHISEMFFEIFEDSEQRFEDQVDPRTIEREEQEEWESYCDDLYLGYHGHRYPEDEPEDPRAERDDYW